MTQDTQSGRHVLTQIAMERGIPTTHIVILRLTRIKSSEILVVRSKLARLVRDESPQI